MNVVVENNKKALSGYIRNTTKFNLSKTGLLRYNSIHKDLQKIIDEYLYYKDLSVVCGERTKEDQEAAKKSGNSKASYGQSPHNFKPSRAVDIYPYPVPTIINKKGEKIIDDNSKEWDNQAKLFLEIAKELGVSITWGGCFKSIIDKPHFELTNWKIL